MTDWAVSRYPPDRRLDTAASLLMLAASRGEDNKYFELRRANPDLNVNGLICDPFAATALMAAVTGGNQFIIGDVLASGAEVEASETRDGMRALAIAVARGRTARGVEMLLAAGADPEAKSSGWKTALLHLNSSPSGVCGEKCRLLLEAGADPNAEDSSGWTVLHRACSWGAEDLIRVLLADERTLVYRTVAETGRRVTARMILIASMKSAAATEKARFELALAAYDEARRARRRPS